MNTGELIECRNIDGTTTMELVIWCDLCGYGARHNSDPNDKYHFCHRHKETEIRAFMSGSIAGYFEREAQLTLF